VVGSWYGYRTIGGLGGGGYTVWDAYYAYDDTASWSDQASGVVAAGSTIIGTTDGLEQRFLPLLE
jgi:hypothetical protein